MWAWVGERGRYTEREVRGGGGGKPVKSYEICPLNNQRPNQFVQRPREAGGLQRNVWSGRSLTAHPSPYLRQTHNSQSLSEFREEMARRDGTEERDTHSLTHTHIQTTFIQLLSFLSSSLFFRSFSVFYRYCNAYTFPYFMNPWVLSTSFRPHTFFISNYLVHSMSTTEVCGQLIKRSQHLDCT